MRHLFLAPLALLSSLAPLASAAVTAEAQHLHSLLYADVKDQPLLRLCIHSDQDGVKLTALRFELKGSAALKSLKLYRSGNEGRTPLFSLRAERAQEKCTPVRFKAKRAKASVTFTGSLTLQKGENYIWLAADVSESAASNAVVDAELTHIKTSDSAAPSIKGNPDGALSVYPFAQRVIPYYRDSHLLKWAPDLLTPTDFKYLTDFIYFRLSCDENGNLVGADNAEFLRGIPKLKKLRGEEPVTLLLGLASCDPGFTATSADAGKRRRFAQQLKSFLDKHELDGVDLDWEYPDNEAQWINFAYMINVIREEFGASGKTVSAAVNMYHMSPNRLAVDVLDYVNVMCYDRPAEHSTMAHFKEEITKSLSMMPRQKIIIGLPFYSNNVEGKRDWDAQTGYDGILKENPRLKTSDNYAHVKGSRHYFNGARLIGEKCRFAKAQKLGGVMVWAYDCDIPFKNKLSLRRAMFKEIRRTAR